MTYDPLEYADHVTEAMSPALLSDHRDACLACEGMTETIDDRTVCRNCGLTAVETDVLDPRTGGAKIDAISLGDLSDRQFEQLMERIGRRDVLVA